MSDKPEVGFGFGVEGSGPLLDVIRQLRVELKNVQQQQQETASSAEVLSRAWRGLVELAGALKIAQFAKEVFDTAVNLGKLSQITGVSTQTLSVYYKAATDVGVAHEAVDKGIIKLSRSFVQLQQGNKAAAAGFAILHLTAKDFIGLNPDEKLRKVTDAFAGLKSSGEKAAAAQALFSKGGAALIPVLDQLGKEHFKEVADQAERLGLIFNGEMVEGALRAKAALADLKGVAEGATAQFETGLLPALADTADAMVHTVTGTSGISNGFKAMGEFAGNAIKYVIEFLSLLAHDAAATGLQIVEIFSFAWEEVKIGAISLFSAFEQAATGNFSAALQTIKLGARDTVNEYKDAVGRIHAIRQQERDSDQQFHDDLFNNKNPRPLPKPTGEAGDPTKTGLGRGEDRGIRQKAQDELTLYRDLARQKAEQDKRDYDQGLISLEEYFGRRRAIIVNEFVQELKALGAEKLALQGQLAKSTDAKEQISLKQQLAHIDAQIGDDAVKRDTELAKIDDEHAKAKQDHLLKELEAQKKLSDMEGDRVKAAQLAQQIEDLQLRKELEQLGRTKAEIDDFLARFSAARDIRTKGTEAQQGFEGGTAELANKKASLEEQVADNQLQPFQAERQLRAEYEKEIPVLQAKVQLLRDQAAAAQAAANARGETGTNAQAAQLTKQADEDETKLIKLRTEMARMDTSWMSWRTNALKSIHQVSTEISTAFNGWIQGHEKFTDAAKHLWNNMVMSGIQGLEKLAASFIEHHLQMLIVKRVTNQAEVASDASSAAQKETIERQSGLKSIFKSAKIAAAKAWEALASIPYVGPILGAIAAAATFAGVMALGAFAEGGYVGSGAPRTIAFSGGGQIAARSMLGGGLLRGPGTSISDSIPIMASDKEYVVSAKGVSSVGVDTLDAINRGAFRGASRPPIRQPAPYSASGFRNSSGGILKSLTAPGSGGGTTINNHNTIQSSSIDSKDFRDHLDDHMDYVADGLKERMRNFRFP